VSSSLAILRMRARSWFVVLSALLSLPAVVAQGQRTRADSSFRVAVIGQTDSAGRALVERVRTRLVDATRGGRGVVIPTRDIARVIEQAYRGTTDPIGLHDIREVGKLVRASIVLAIVPDTTRAGNLDAVVFRSRAVDYGSQPAGARTLGSWPRAAVEPTSRAIFRAFQADSLYRQVVGR